MAFISVTRLRLRSIRFLPTFALHTWHSARQARRSHGYLGGYFSKSGGLTFWTVTSWANPEAMWAYRNSGAHMKAMPRLIDWCNEAAVAHWEQPGIECPAPLEAARQMASQGKLSKVRHPTTAHAAGLTWSDSLEPKHPFRLPPLKN